MGWFGNLFTKKGDVKIDKIIAKAIDKTAQSIDRMDALEKLKEIGSKEALIGLCRRFDIYYDKSIEDEEEKEWVYNTLIGFAEKAIPSLKEYLLQTESLSWPLKVIEKIASQEELFSILETLCQKNDNTYTRDPSRKIQLLGFIAEHNHNDERIVNLIIPYFEDMNESVRYAAVDVFKNNGKILNSEKIERLCTMFLMDESKRIRLRIIDVLAENELRLPKQSQYIEMFGMIEKLVPGVKIDTQQKIKLPVGKQK